jgi:hypothetical protein
MKKELIAWLKAIGYSMIVIVAFLWVCLFILTSFSLISGSPALWTILTSYIPAFVILVLYMRSLVGFE